MARLIGRITRKQAPSITFLHARAAVRGHDIHKIGAGLMEKVGGALAKGNIKRTGPSVWMYDHRAGGMVLMAGFPVAKGYKPGRMNRETYRKWLGFDASGNLTELQMQVKA